MSAEQNVTEAPVETYVDRAPAQDESSSNQNGGGFEVDENGERIPHGMGQSKSSRRRRRKRKNKSTPGAADAAPQGSAQASGATAADSAFDPALAGVLAPIPILPGESLAMAQNGNQGRGQVRALQAQAQNGAQPATQSNNGSAQNAPGTKRWKKKFRDRDRRTPDGVAQFGGGAGIQPGSQANGAPQNGFSGGFRGPDTHQPGNSAGGGKRKGSFSQSGGKQQRQASRGFVGPMDHSYRVANGNVFDPAPATGDSYSNGHNGGGGRGRSYQGDSQPIDYSQGRAIPIPDDAPTRIYFFIEDLFFTAKIQETARKLGVKVAFIKNEKEQIAALTSATEEERPGLIVFDLNNANAKPMTLIPKLKAKLKKQTSIVGFLSHLQGDLKAKAVEAGCDSVMPRAAFSQNLPNLLRRYGIEEVDETNFNQ